MDLAGDPVEMDFSEGYMNRVKTVVNQKGNEMNYW
jgi:hypothetical protein